jgi:glycosyltransferase involved in cell wall biosynthesis
VEISRYPVLRQPLVSPLFYPLMRRAMAELSRLPATASLLMQLCRATPLVPALARALRQDREPVNLIHATNIPFDSLIYHSYRYAKRRGIPFVVTPFTHLGEPDDTRVRKYYTMRHQLAMEKAAAAVIVATNLERDYLAERGVDPRKMHRVGIGVNPAQALGGDGAAFRAKYNLGDGPIVFSMGVTAYDKGTVHLVEAMRRLWARGSEAELALAGATMTHFLSYIASIPAAELRRLHVLGPVSDEDKRGLFAAGDVFAMPSRTDSFGIVYLEAWLYGKPVIGAQAGGVPEVINADRDGLLIRFGDVAALAAAIERLLTDRPLAAALGDAGRRKVMAGMTWDNVYQNILAVYEQLI